MKFASVAAAMVVFSAGAAAFAGVSGGVVHSNVNATLEREMPIGSTASGGPEVVGANAVYSDVTNFRGTGVTFGPTSTNFTYAIADDLTTTLTAAQPLTQFRFSIANFNSATTAINSYVRFYDDDGAGGNPGTVLGGFNFNPVNVGATSVGVLTFTIPAAQQFNIPAGKVWAVQYFSTASAATATNVGAGLYSPVDVGSSTVDEWDSDFLAVDGTSFTGNNPLGTVYSGGYSNGTIPANYGWELISPPIPEPTSLAAVAGLGVLLRRRRA